MPVRVYSTVTIRLTAIVIAIIMISNQLIKIKDNDILIKKKKKIEIISLIERAHRTPQAVDHSVEEKTYTFSRPAISSTSRPHAPVESRLFLNYTNSDHST